MIKGYKHLTKIAENLDLPLWWVESVAVEYLDCREYLKDGNFWLFNFNKLRKEDIAMILGTKVVFTDTVLFQNIKPEDASARLILGLMGMPMAQLDAGSNILPNGIVSEKYFPFQGNSIDAWDQKLSFSEYAKIFDEGRFYQLKIAQFGPFHPTSTFRGWFKSDFLDLEPLRIINDEIYDLRNRYCSRDNPIVDNKSLEILRGQVIEKYSELEKVKAPLRQQVLDWYRKRKNEFIRNEKKVQPEAVLPTLTHLDSLQVADGKYKVRSNIEPLLYRAAIKNLAEAKKEVEKRNKKSELPPTTILNETEASALCIISSVTCAEAYINSVIQGFAPSLWDTLESMSLSGKWLLLPAPIGIQDCFEKGKGVYNKFCEVVQWRNDIVHYKFGFEKTKRLDDGRVTSRTYSIYNAKNAHIAVESVAAMIQQLSNKLQIPYPPWLDPHGQWLKDISGKELFSKNTAGSKK
jgi:hypothetical protein